MDSMKELKDVIDGILALEKLGYEVMKDGKVSMADLPVVLALLPQTAMAVYKAVEGADKIPEELSGLTQEQGAELVAHVMAKLTVEDAKAREIVQQSLKITKHIGLLVKAIVG